MEDFKTVKKKVTVTLFEDDAEWGLSLDGGLSLLLRRLLREERKRQLAQQKPPLTPAPQSAQPARDP